MCYMTKALSKQLQFIEIEIHDYIIAKNQGYRPTYPEVYYASLAHAYKNLKDALFILNKTNKIRDLHVH